MPRFYVSLTWDGWPDGGSFATVVVAADYNVAEQMAKQEMAESRAEEQELCYHCGADTDDGEGFDGLCGDCADQNSDEEGEALETELDTTNAGALRMYAERANSWFVVDIFDLDNFIQDHAIKPTDTPNPYSMVLAPSTDSMGTVIKPS